MRPGEIRSTISEELPEARQCLGQALREMYESIPVHNGKRLSQVELLRRMQIGRASRSSLCRYLQGENLPAEDFVVRFYQAISELTTGTLPRTCEELLAMREQVEAADGRRRVARQDRKRQVDELTRRVNELTADSAKSGDSAMLVALPPVPQAAIEALQLVAQGKDAQTVTLLSRLSEHLGANEVALCIAHFRHQHYDDLADTLIQIYGRDHREDQRQQEVIRVSMTLREYQLQSDADTLLTMLI